MYSTTLCWLQIYYLGTYYVLKSKYININLKIYLAPLVSDKGGRAVVNTENDFTGFSSVSPVCVPDKPCSPPNCSLKLMGSWGKESCNPSFTFYASL